MAVANVLCYYCGERFDRNKEPFHKVNGTRYAHEECHKEHESMTSIDKKSLKALEDYIKKLFDVKQLSAKIRSQIKTFTHVNLYTYEGILKTLQYVVEIKHNPVEKMNGGIGIVPYVYDESIAYYSRVEAKINVNKEEDIAEYVPREKRVEILNPKRKTKRNDGFDFLD